MRINLAAGAEKSAPISDVLKRIEDVTDNVNKTASLRGNHIFIGFPSRDERCYIGLVDSVAVMVAGFLGCGVEVTMDTFRNSSFPDIPRNYILKRFYENEGTSIDNPYTHVMQIDDDMAWKPYEAPIEMMKVGKDFIGGIGPLKRAVNDQAFAASPEHGQNPHDSIIEMINVGGAFIMLSRNCVETMVKEYDHLRHPAIDNFPMLFERWHDAKQDYGEDMMFCKRWRDIGGKVWGYTDITFEHLGHYATVGNYKQYLNQEINNPDSKHVKPIVGLDKPFEEEKKCLVH